MTEITNHNLILYNKCNCLVDIDYLIEAILWYANGKTINRQKSIFLYGKYPAVSISDKKIHVHRIIVSYYYKSIIPTHLYVHHRDGNKLNSILSNLELIEASSHQSLHNKGKSLSTTHRAKISNKNRNRKGIRINGSRSDITTDMVINLINKGFSIYKTASMLGVSWNVVNLRITTHHEKGIAS